MSKFKKVRTWKDILKDPRVERAYIETDYCWDPDHGKSIWVELKGEYINTFSDTRSIHESTVKDCIEQLNLMVREATPKEVKQWFGGH